VRREQARHAAPDLFSEAECRADLTGCAVAALKAIMLDERCLEWMQVSIGGDPFDRRDGATFILHRQGKARHDAFAVHQYGARTTRTLIAALLGTGQMKMIPQEIEQRCAVIGRRWNRSAIDDY
jgi:hypothetical protein